MLRAEIDVFGVRVVVVAVVVAAVVDKEYEIVVVGWRQGMVVGNLVRLLVLWEGTMGSQHWEVAHLLCKNVVDHKRRLAEVVDRMVDSLGPKTWDDRNVVRLIVPLKILGVIRSRDEP